MEEISNLMYVGEGFDRQEQVGKYEGWNFNSGNYLFTTDTK